MRARTERLSALGMALTFLLSSGHVLAQDDEFGGEASDDDEEAGDLEDADEAGGEQADAPETYTVKPGDTLWNLSGKFLNNPWYWPKIWSYNPQLDNPNWVQPGTVIRFYPGPTDTPVEIKPDGDPADGQDGDTGGDSDDDGSYEDADLAFPEADRLNNFDGARATRAINAMINKRGVLVRREMLAPKSDIEKAGALLNSSEPKSELSNYDSVWLSLKNQGTQGDVLGIYREERELYHPVTGVPLGTVVHLLGTVRVDSDEKEALGTILTAYAPIHRGDLVMPLDDRFDIESVEPVPNEKEAKGYVCEESIVPATLIGEHHTVFVDLGEKDGVKVGNTFTIVRGYDPVEDKSGLPDEVIGTAIVFDVASGTSQSLITYANRDIVAGDRVEIRVE